MSPARAVLRLGEHYQYGDEPRTPSAPRAHTKEIPMKKGTKSLKLKLTRDTLRLLDKSELSAAEGRGTKNTLTGCTGFENSGCPNSCLC
jgi:hypothetical protein